MARVFWITEFNREQIPEIVKGEGLRPRRISSGGLQQIETSNHELLGVWRTSRKSKLPPLPQVVIGRPAALEDLIAWTATYVPGLSPLSNLMRLMTPEAFRHFRNRDRLKDWEVAASAAVGLMYGEVLSYANLSTDIRTIDIEICRSTLSYVLMRNLVLGGNEDDVMAIAENWMTLRQRAGLSTNRTSCELILSIAIEWIRSQGEMSLFDTHNLPLPIVRGELLGQLELLGELPGKRKKVVDSLRNTGLSAEEKVRIFDQMALNIADDPVYKDRDRPMMLAQLAFWCRKGFSNQWAILQPFQARLPESAIWLGALQAREPMADMLFVGRTVGLKLAMELF